MMRWSVSWSLARASSGMRLSLPFKSSLTSSWKDLPKMLDCQMALVSPLELLKQEIDHLLALLFVAHDGRDLGFDVRTDHVDGGGGGLQAHAIASPA